MAASPTRPATVCWRSSPASSMPWNAPRSCRRIWPTMNEAQAVDRGCSSAWASMSATSWSRPGTCSAALVNIAPACRRGRTGGARVSEAARSHPGDRLPLPGPRAVSDRSRTSPRRCASFIWRRRVRPSRAADVTRPAHRPSIAVLPFDNMSSATEQDYFAEGVADDIITELSRNRDLFVVARHSSFFIAQQAAIPPPSAGRSACAIFFAAPSAGARAAAADSASHRVRVGQRGWAERFDRKLEDLFDVQLEVARTVTATITGRLSALADDAIAAKAPESLEAYDHVLRAQQYLQRYTRADYARAGSIWRRRYGPIRPTPAVWALVPCRRL